MTKETLQPKTPKENIEWPSHIVKPLKWTKIRRTFHTSQYATSKIIKAFIIPSGAVNVTIEELNPSQNKLGRLKFSTISFLYHFRICEFSVSAQKFISFISILNLWFNYLMIFLLLNIGDDNMKVSSIKADADAGKKWTSSKFTGFTIISNVFPIFHNVSPIFH